MAKAKMTTVFYCQECGHESSKWMGQCPGCRAWNSFVEETIKSTSVSKNGSTAKSGTSMTKPVKLQEITGEQEARYTTHLEELDRVLGGGIVKGALVLVGGDPGIGKSTLLLQVCRNLSSDQKKVLYVSGEESLQQIKMRADRIGSFSDKMELLCETSLDAIENSIRSSEPEFVVIDSIQTMMNEELSAAPGSVSQVRETTARLLQISKSLNITIFIVGHVTKEGTVAGPRVLEHMVDCVLYFEGDRYASYRVLRGVKNRFGATNEIGVFEMRGDGLREVKNPSEFMLSGRPEDACGSVVVCSAQGTRTILLEVQALVTKTNFGFPKRQAMGTDSGRMNLLMAVLEKRIGLQIGDCDAYVNVAGGMKVQEPAIDLGVIIAIVSSFKNKGISSKMAVFGEVGLSGEVRAVSLAKERVQEAKKLGFDTVILPKATLSSVSDIKGIKLLGVETLVDVLDML